VLRVVFPGLAPWANEMTPCGLSNGLLLRKSPWDPALTYRALTDPTAVGFFTAPLGCEKYEPGVREWMVEVFVALAVAGLAKGAVVR